jgi:RHS repeat-associated protein
VKSRSDVTTSATFNAADQLTARGSVTYSYDANGNQSGSSAGQALAYNGADQTTSLKRAGGSALAATYAGANQVERASAGATTFTNTLLGVSAGGTTGYTRDPAGALVGIRGTNRSYYLFDGRGSVVAVTSSSGSVTNSYTYDPFGVTTETKALLTNVFNPWRYAGQYQDTTTGLYKMGARYYQPELGRWTQPDPSGQEANPYLYVAGNPVNFVDPSGLLPSAEAIINGIQIGFELVGIAAPQLALIIDAGQILIDVAQALFSDCPLRQTLLALIQGLLEAATFGSLDEAFKSRTAAVADAIVSSALDALDYGC